MSDAISPEAIRSAREAAGLSQSEAAEKSGLTRATIQNAETGRRSPSGLVLVALSRAYGVPMESFVAHTQNDHISRGARGIRAAEDTDAPLASSARESASGAR